MNDFATALQKAVSLIVVLDPELCEIAFLSLRVSLTASAFAFVIGAPLGIALAMYRFWGRNALVVIANALLGLPPVVAGLFIYLLLSRSGPLGRVDPIHQLYACARLAASRGVRWTHRRRADFFVTFAGGGADRAHQVDGRCRARRSASPGRRASYGVDAESPGCCAQRLGRTAAGGLSRPLYPLTSVAAAGGADNDRNDRG